MKPRDFHLPKKQRRGGGTLAILSVAAMAATALAQEETSSMKPEEVESKSLPLRTALYHDPTLGAPLERLLEIYRSAHRAKELVETYRQHVAQYPADAGALIVLVRLMEATNDANAGVFVRQATKQFPDSAFLQYLLAEHLAKAQEPGALDALDRAITLETLPERKRLWIEKLLPLAAAEGHPEIARKHLGALAQASATAEEKLDVARKLISQKFYEPALTTLAAASALQPAAETGVELELTAATAEIGLQRTEAAATRLDRLLGRLAADFWRRTEILHRRTALVKTDAEREKMLSAARERLKKAPGDETAALEVSQLLAAFEFRREALDVLLAAARQTPASTKLEKAALELFDLLRDERGREAFLATLLKTAPDRLDLGLARTRSLFLLGRRDEALALFDRISPRLDASTRITQALELARFLRRSSLSADAATIFERVLALAPERLDLRRELAETWLALGRRSEASKLFTGKVPEGAETESVLDVVQFLMQQGLFEQAKTTLQERLAKEPENFDLLLAQVQLAGKSAAYDQGVKLLASLRGVCDTIARYQRWLEAALAFHEIFETTGTFLSEEQSRLLAAGDWRGADLERRLAFADAANTGGRKSEVAAMFEQALTQKDLPAATRIELRRRQLAAAESNLTETGTAEDQLKQLMKDDPANAEEYRIRLALLYMRNRRQDQALAMLRPNPAQEALAGFDFDKIKSASLLNSLLAILPQIGGASVQLPIVERLTTLDPSNRAVWEQWITALAMGGEDERLRTAIRRLLAGIDKMPLTDECRRALQRQLQSSYWRSLNVLFGQAGANETQLAEALPLLDAVSRLAETRGQWLWITWTRAYALNLLGRIPARDEAIAELERVAALPEPKPAQPAAAPALLPLAPPGLDDSDESDAPTAAAVPATAAPVEEKSEPRDVVAFPDGLIIGLREAREILTRPTAEPARKMPPAGAGPRHPLHVRWAFETDSRSAVYRVEPLGSDHLLVTDLTGTFYRIEKRSGKLVWSRPGPPPLSPPNDPNNGYYARNLNVSYAQPLGAGDRIYLPAKGAIECWAAADGQLLWRSGELSPTGAASPIYPRLLLDAGRLLVCDASRLAISALDPANGKLLWDREYASERSSGGVLSDLNSGVSFSQGRVLLYGAGTVIVDARTGDLQWRFDPSRVQPFPVSLAPAASAAAPAPAAYSGRGYRARGFSSYPSGAYGGNMSWFTYAQLSTMRGQGWMPQPGQQLAIASPATMWSAPQMNQGQPRLGALYGDDLLLCGSNALSLVSLTRPFHTPALNSGGLLLGVIGHSAWTLANNSVVAADLDTGNCTTINLAPTPDASRLFEQGQQRGYSYGEPVQGATDGLVVYTSTARGVALHHARTGQLLGSMPWPESIAPAADPNPGARNAQIFPTGIFRQDQNGGGSFEPLVATLRDGTFYTTAEPARLVAIDAAPKKAEPQ